MLRIFPLLALALLPALVGLPTDRSGAAAPVPPGGRVEFGTNGLLTRADLEKVKFDSRPVKDADPDLKDESRKLDIAVHLPWTRFREGEPIPAYFVVRNRGGELALSVEMELSGGRRVVWSRCKIEVYDRATGERVRSIGQTCSFGRIVDVPAGGFYCARGDIGSIRGEPLPP